jgi:hypothetical protein
MIGTAKGETSSPRIFAGRLTVPEVAMTPEEFRTLGHQLIDWIADYRARAAELPGDKGDIAYCFCKQKAMSPLSL